MSQTNQTVNALVNKAFRLIGEFDVRDVIPSEDITEGIDSLNDIINTYSLNASLIPYTKKIEFQTVADKNEYTFSNYPGVTADIESNRLTSVEYLQLKFKESDSSIYSLYPLSKTQLFAQYYTEKDGTIPGFYLLEESELFTTLRLYPTPDKTYFMTLRGKFYLDKFEDSTNITNVPLGLQRFLRFKLAKELSMLYPSSSWQQKHESELMEMEAEVRSGNDIDMTSRASNILGNNYNSNNGGGIGNSIIAG